MNLAHELEQGVIALGLELSPQARQKLLDYLALLEKWNKVYNLTAIREPQKMVSHHLLDSLAVAPHLEAKSLLDVGSGAGLPGIPLAIARKEWQITLLESNHKKSAFLQQTVMELKLANVSVQNQRVENFKPQKKFDCVISRAFSDLAEFAELAGHLCQGYLAAMKGVYPHEELAQLPQEFRAEVIALRVPGVEAQRHLVIVRKSA
ncbi:MAG: 16S rRNA (guanine(527)-N(7))-methyltransferase RsmG [Burkholderiales bacterium]